MLTGVTSYFEADNGPLWMSLVVAPAMCAPFLIRRQRPVLAFAIMAAAGLLQWLLGLTLLLADVLLFAAVYNVASRCRWQIVAVSAGLLELGAVLAVVRWFPLHLGSGWLVSLGSATILVGSMWIWGNSVGIRRAYLASLEDRAVQAERERDNQAQLAADAERARIARELHDVVSHGLSAIVVQADGAGYAIDTEPEQARQAVGTIATTGRNALAEMNRMLGVLRDRDGHHDYRPQPGVAQLDQLVDQMRQAGLPVQFTVGPQGHSGASGRGRRRRSEAEPP